jgi:hypothetical protein
VVVFMALMFLCCFLLFGMSELEWILLDIGWMRGKGVAKRWVVSRTFIVELKKEKQREWFGFPKVFGEVG